MGRRRKREERAGGSLPAVMVMVQAVALKFEAMKKMNRKKTKNMMVFSFSKKINKVELFLIYF